MQDAKLCTAPVHSHLEETSVQGQPFPSTVYRLAIERFMYLMVYTRPDLAVLVGRLSQNSEKTTKALWICIKRNFCNWNGTVAIGIVYSANSVLDSLIAAYSG